LGFEGNPAVERALQDLIAKDQPLVQPVAPGLGKEQVGFRAST
jgi:hypothetical protein